MHVTRYNIIEDRIDSLDGGAAGMGSFNYDTNVLTVQRDVESITESPLCILAWDGKRERRMLGTLVIEPSGKPAKKRPSKVK
jgi:hypothetical protein